MMKVCSKCGRQYEARRKTSKYCSDACRKKAFRERDSWVPMVPDAPMPPPPPATFDDVAEALDEARRVSNDFGRLAHTAPRQLRPGCARIGEGIARLIREEEW